MDILVVISIALGFVVGLFFIGAAFHRKQLARALELAQEESKKSLEQARKEADVVMRQALRDAKDESRKSRQRFEEEAKQRRSEIAKIEQKLKAREESIDKKFSIIEKREVELDLTAKKLQAEEQLYKALAKESEQTLEKSRKMLQNIAGMSQEEAKRELVKSLETVARDEARESIKRIEEEARVEAEARAKSVVSLAVQRIAGEFVSDSSVTVLSLPGEDMKGRIIGREGRNIRAIEQATGVDIIIDDTPEAVIISSFNPIRREVAKATLEKLIADGRIHPARIDETAKRTFEEFAGIIQEYGEKASFETGLTDLHPELTKLLGKLRFRTVGQQTVLQHSVETAHICGIMAAEMGLNVKKAKRCGLLHDIGKAVDQEVEGHHAHVGAETCLKYGESSEIVEAIRSHHQENLIEGSPYNVVLFAANQLSSSRPGARKELMETYIKRLDDMEKIVRDFGGVSQAFVMQAGREIYTVVNPLTVRDRDLNSLASDIASRLRQQMTFPGQVRVTLVRESQASDFAK